MRPVILLSIGAISSAPLRAQDSTVLHSVNRYVESERARQRIPGISVAILRGDRVLLARGYGMANVELGVPASDSTIYQSGSVGKQFTAAAVVMLAEQGRLGLDERITRWLKEGNGVWDGISVRHLLTHTSGMAEYADSTFDYRKDYTENQLVRFAASRPLDFPPGDKWNYSNTGYLLLGVLIHRVTGRFYGDVLRDMIFAPLGMKSTRIISEADIVPNRSAGYRLVGNQLKNQEWVSPSLNTTADGALYFSVKDLAKWAVGLNRQRTPSAKVLKEAWTPVRLNDGGVYPYGFGWGLSEQRAHPRIGHTGSWQGFTTAIHRYPEFDLTVVVLANLAEAHSGALAQAIAGILEPAVQPPQLLATTLPGPSTPTPIPDLLHRIAAADSGGVTAGLHRSLLPLARNDLGMALRDVKSWTALGCEGAAGRGITKLDATIEHICYARGVGKGRRVIFSVFYSGGWRAGYFEYQDY